MRCRVLLILAAVAIAGPAHAVGSLVDVSVYDVTAGRTLPFYRHDGRCYVAGEPGHEYRLSIASRESGRLLNVVSVDGVNVVTGETAAPQQSGYVLAPFQGYDVAGWRKSLDRVASFYFTSLSDSYAARTGRARNVGVIGVAVFREQVRPQPPAVAEDAVPPSPAERARDGNASAAAAAPSAEDAAADAVGAPAAKAESRVGTGHGRSLDSLVFNTEFERASSAPAEVIAIYYDSRSNLVAQGVIPRPTYSWNYRPDPFPNGFVPDP